MIHYRVVPYPDEILYSQLARLFEHCLQVHPFSGLDWVLKKGKGSATIDLPNNLNALYEVYFSKVEGSSEALIRKYTLYPFYESFFKVHKRDSVLKAMLSNFGSQIHIKAGINTSGISRGRYPRYCPVCLSESFETYGEAYWMRIHQIPGVLVCPIHNTHVDMFRPSNDRLNQSLFFSASELNRGSLVAMENKDPRLLEVSCTFRSILNGAHRFDINNLNYKRAILINSKYRQGSLINYNTLCLDIETYYGQRFLQHYFSRYSDPLSWVPAIVRRPLTYFDPVKHIVLHNFVEQIERSLVLLSKALWDGSWQCINGACPAYKKHRQERAIVMLNAKTGKETALVKCSCGMEYRLTYTLKNGKRVRSTTVKEYGELWRNTVKIMADRGSSMRAIQRTVCTGVASIRTFLRGGDSKAKDLQFKVTLKESREQWIALLKSFDQHKISQARRRDNRLYKWLYNNDKNWLQVTNQLNRTGRSQSELRLDWKEIDQKLVLRISEVIGKLRKEGFKKRISRNLVSKVLDLERNYFRIHKGKLVRSTEILAKLTESKEEFVTRRVSGSLQALRKENQKVTVSGVLKRANLRLTAQRAKAVREVEVVRNQKLA